MVIVRDDRSVSCNEVIDIEVASAARSVTKYTTARAIVDAISLALGSSSNSSGPTAYATRRPRSDLQSVSAYRRRKPNRAFLTPVIAENRAASARAAGPQVNETTTVRCVLHVPTERAWAGRLGQLYRMRESVTNALRHDASEVRIEYFCDGTGSRSESTTVKASPLAKLAEGPRPARLRYRAALIGATLEVAPRVGAERE
jgi:hypothetical protein